MTQPSSDKSAIDVRAATTADVADLVECHLACWRETYRGLASDDYLRGLDRGRPARIDYWTTAIERGETPHLAVDGGTVVGLAHAGPTEDDDLRPGLELFAIYVRATYWGTGLGDRLLEATIGPHPASLWVVRSNTRAVRFYHRHGFTPDGSEKPHPAFTAPAIRLIRPATPRPSDQLGGLYPPFDAI